VQITNEPWYTDIIMAKYKINHPDGLDVPCYDEDMFTWLGGKGGIEISEMRSNPWIGRLYRDAADVGFAVKMNNGLTVLFTLWCDRYSNTPGECAGWVLRGIGYEEQNLEIVVYND